MTPKGPINLAEVSVTIRDINGTIIGREWVHRLLVEAVRSEVRADAILTSYQIGKIPNLRGDSLIMVTT